MGKEKLGMVSRGKYLEDFLRKEVKEMRVIPLLQLLTFIRNLISYFIVK